LWWSRLLTALATLLVAVGIGIAWVASIPGDARKTVYVLVVSEDGAVVCAPVGDGTLAVDMAARSALRHANTVGIVETCT
jgi:hypothetical protein